MNHDPCRWILDRLPLFVGGDLTVDETRRVERHLIGCAPCRLRRQSLRQSLDLLHLHAGQGDEALTAATSESLWPALSAQIRQSRRRRLWFERVWDEDRSPWLVPAMAAGLLLATFAAAWSWRGSSQAGREQVAQMPVMPRPALPQGGPVTASNSPEKPQVNEVNLPSGPGNKDPQRSY